MSRGGEEIGEEKAFRTPGRPSTMLEEAIYAWLLKLDLTLAKICDGLLDRHAGNLFLSPPSLSVALPSSSPASTKDPLSLGYDGGRELLEKS